MAAGRSEKTIFGFRSQSEFVAVKRRSLPKTGMEEVNASFEVSLASDAVTDIENALVYFNQISIRLKNQFERELKTILRRLENNPFLFSIRYEQVRLCHFNKFPYSIHFRINQDLRMVIVLAVFHQHKNPESWDFILPKNK
jgi:plasmid stabilization system protein ParE